MSHLRLKVKLNKGRRGIPLDKLEHFVAAMRKFLVSASRDMDIPSPEFWSGLDFRNGSLEWTNECASQISIPQIVVFNQAITDLSKGRMSPRFQEATNNVWYSIFERLDPGELINFGIYPDDGKRTKWLEVTREVALLPTAHKGLSIRESIGSLQGIVHSWYKASEPPYFMLRELATKDLIKCYYEESDYDAVLEANKTKTRVIHVHGRVFMDTIQRCVKEIRAERIIPTEPFTFADFDKVWSSRKSQ